VLLALLGLVYWQQTGVRAVPGLIEALQSEDLQTQMLAAEGLKAIGPEAKAAVAPLVAAAISSSSPSISTAAAGALPSIDLSAARQVMTTWLPKLQDPDAQVKRDAASVLGGLGPVAKPAVSALIAALDDPDLLLRERATRALGSIGIPVDAVMRELIHALHDPEWTVRYAAVTQFSFSGFSSPESLAILRELTNDSNPSVAGLAKSAVASAERQIQVSTYTYMLKQGTNRTYTLHQLAKLGPRAAETASGIADVLTTGQPLERYLAVCALEAIGPSSLAALKQAVNDTDPIVRETAADAVRALETTEGQKR
jgi:HEAT repeat protein